MYVCVKWQSNLFHSIFMTKDFPVFRKYPDQKTFFKIESNNHLVELKIIGKSFLVTRIEAKILPERILIQDLIEAKENGYLKIEEEEFEQQWKFCHDQLKPLGL